MSDQDLYGLLIPVLEGRLLVPRACVAEVTTLQGLQEMPGAPPWYLGLMPWNGRSVPVVSFEGTCGRHMPAAGGRTRVVVFTCLGQKLPAGHFGIVTQGFPQLVQVSEAVLKPEQTTAFAERMPVLCQVRMINEIPLIPDLERLEEIIADETTVTAA